MNHLIWNGLVEPGVIAMLVIMMEVEKNGCIDLNDFTF